MKRTKHAAACALPLLALAGLTSHARADEHMVQVDAIDVQSPKGLGAFDISYVDPRLGLYILADRTNASVDFVNARDDTFIGRVGGFTGVVLNASGTANNSLSGPDGVTIVGNKEVWAGDGDSTVKIIDIASMKLSGDPINTGGKFRCDEMAWDAADHILAVANNADTPPFITMINTDTRQIVGKIVFDGTKGTPDATATGIEQSQWSPTTGLFYVSVPQIDPNDATKGGIAVIDPTTFTVTKTYPVDNCTPGGLALGPNGDAVIGCSASFGTSPNVLTQTAIINLPTGTVTDIPEVGGSDEVWYDPATKHYYTGSRNNTDNTGKPDPVLGTIDALSKVVDRETPTSISAHSVAADRVSHHVFVPIGFPAAGTSDPTNKQCPDVTKGCIAVYLPSSIDSDDGAPSPFK